MSRQKEATGAAGRIADALTRLGPYRLHYGPDERPGGEVLPCAAFDVLGVLLQEALVDGPLDIHIQAQPGLAVDQLHQGRSLAGDWILLWDFRNMTPSMSRSLPSVPRILR